MLTLLVTCDDSPDTALPKADDTGPGSRRADRELAGKTLARRIRRKTTRQHARPLTLIGLPVGQLIDPGANTGPSDCSQVRTGCRHKTAPR